MTETSEIDRLAAGLPPATPDDDEIERIIGGAAPATPEDDTIARLSASSPALRAVGASEWGPATLKGSRELSVGKFRFSVPRGARVKRASRAGTVWVHHDGQTFIYSELGELIQTPAERRRTRFDLL